LGHDNIIRFSSCTCWPHNDPYMWGSYFLGRFWSIHPPVELNLPVKRWSLPVGSYSLMGNWNIHSN